MVKSLYQTKTHVPGLMRNASGEYRLPFLSSHRGLGGYPGMAINSNMGGIRTLKYDSRSRIVVFYFNSFYEGKPGTPYQSHLYIFIDMSMINDTDR